LSSAINPAFAERTDPAGYPVTHYVGISGVGADAESLPATDPRAGVFGNEPRGLDALKDGASNTIAVMGVREKFGPWSAGGPSTVKPLTTQPYVNGPDGFGTGQANGMWVGMADGSARFVSSDVDPKVLEQLSTINGGEADAIAAIEPKTPPKINSTPETTDVPIVEPAEVDPAAELAGTPRGGGVRDVDVNARLADRIPFFQVDRMPLAEFVQLLNELTTLSVSIDFEAISQPGVAQLPITVKSENRLVREIIDEALAEHGLVIAIAGDQLVVRPADAGAASVQKSYDVADLGGGPRSEKGAGATDPASLVQLFVAPSTWDGAGGQGTVSIESGKLIVNQPPVIQRQVAEFLDRLRVARGKRRLSADETRMRLASPWIVAKLKLAPQITVNFPDDTPLLKILAYLSAKAELDFVVDWQSLRAVDTGPGVLTGLHIQNQRLDNTLTALVEPLGLAYRPIDSQTIEISTPEKLDALAVTAFYPLKTLLTAGQSADAIAQRLRKEVSPESWQGKPPAAIAVADPISGTLIVRAPAGVLRAVDIALASWNAEAAEKKAKGASESPRQRERE
jgi:hypothetical protein